MDEGEREKGTPTLRTQKMRLITLAIGLALVAGMVPAAGAKSTASRRAFRAVDTFQIQTNVSLSYSKKKTTFTGLIGHTPEDLSPDESDCENDRKVTLYKVVKGPDNKLGSKTASGDYAFAFSRAQRGTFRVEVAPKTFSDRYGDLISCSGASDKLSL